ncbi:HAMP domain-containing histidine kinase [Shewanella eurypsychrophilus]|uniref:histidine kinase n=1 Tax=Shewanella eurypsychrophilus TaxID=2593656 RepID=A0ABX6V8W4_9GAMM|nr:MULTISPECIES: HAMP domain-containing sensor histidine kinase [Shewanella]QFU21641.1 hypothetical protein FS418_06980 [Shewanella sp. YLB-09]QPG56931.1 HAMP domain-containing histidine kinase [Shewanella eurypsychrophilus]
MDTDSFFNNEAFMPHGMCYLWRPDILWTSVISDVVTALAYFSITLAVIVFVKRRKDLPYPWFFLLSGSVIFLACGLSHLINAIVIWEPIYGVSSISKAVTAVTSLATGIVIWFLLPFFLALPSPSMLERKNSALKLSLEKLNSAQQDIIESQKLASLGHLIAGMAHELNTPIGTSITAATHIESVIKKAKKQSYSIETEELIDEIDQALELVNRNLLRSANLVKIFKQVSANQHEIDDKPFNLYEFTTDLINSLMYKFELAADQVDISCPPALKINSNPNQFIVIMTHLFTNSVEHSFPELSDGLIEINFSLNEDHALVIKYKDNGIGMNQEQLARIFEPFFTTRRGGKGTGLGMTIVYNTVTNMKGQIQCKSALGEGTCFQITVPVEIVNEEPTKPTS